MNSTISWYMTSCSPGKVYQRFGETSSQLVACLAYSSDLKMEAVRSFETPVNFHQTTWRYISEDGRYPSQLLP